MGSHQGNLAHTPRWIQRSPRREPLVKQTKLQFGVRKNELVNLKNEAGSIGVHVRTVQYLFVYLFAILIRGRSDINRFLAHTSH